MDYKGAKDLLEYIFGKEEYLKLFISDYKYKIDYEIKTDYKKKGQIEDMLKKEDTVKGIVERVAENKVFEIVKANVKLDEKELSIEEFNKMFANE